jgi:hypothetical protein
VAALVSQAIRTLRRLSAKPPTKTKPVVSTLSPEPWRLELERWNEEDRYAWEERVAIMLADAGLSLEQAEKDAFLDVSLYRTATR